MQDVSAEIRDCLMDLYLRYIHDKPHTLFHPDLLKEQVRDGTLPKAVLYGIMALAARSVLSVPGIDEESRIAVPVFMLIQPCNRFSEEQEIRQKTKEVFSTAKNLLKMDVDNVCLDNVHASILVGNLCGTEGESLSEGLFFGKPSIEEVFRNNSSDISKVLHFEWQISFIYRHQTPPRTRSPGRSN